MGCGSSTDADPNNNEKKDTKKETKIGKESKEETEKKRKGGAEAELTSEPDIEDVRHSNQVIENVKFHKGSQYIVNGFIDWFSNLYRTARNPVNNRYV